MRIVHSFAFMGFSFQLLDMDEEWFDQREVLSLTKSFSQLPAHHEVIILVELSSISHSPLRLQGYIQTLSENISVHKVLPLKCCL